MNHPALQEVITSHRLVLRALNEDDLDAMFRLRSDAQVAQFLTKPLLKKQEEALEIIRRIIKGIQNGEWYYWAITMNNTMIGAIGIRNFSAVNQYAEIGFELLPAYWRTGIMFESARRVIDWTFRVLDLHRLEAKAQPGNIASVRLLEKLGFKREAFFRDNIFYNSNYFDTVVYGLLKSEWQ